MRALSSGVDRYVAEVSKISTRELKSYEIAALFDDYNAKAKSADKCLFTNVAKEFVVQTISFKNVIRKRDGHFVTDHIWMDKTTDMESLTEGIIVEFDAEPTFYTKQIPELYDRGLRIIGDVEVCAEKQVKAYTKAIQVTVGQKNKMRKFIEEKINDGEIIG